MPEQRDSFDLFDLTWQPRADVGMAEWWAWSEMHSLGQRMEALQAMFIAPPWDEFMAAVPVHEFDQALLELWSGVRFPPGAEGNE